MAAYQLTVNSYDGKHSMNVAITTEHLLTPHNASTIRMGEDFIAFDGLVDGIECVGLDKVTKEDIYEEREASEDSLYANNESHLRERFVNFIDGIFKCYEGNTNGFFFIKNCSLSDATSFIQET